MFKLDSVARVYATARPTRAGVVDALRSLQGEDGGAVLDASCGAGDLARAFVDCSERVDAVDCSLNGGDYWTEIPLPAATA